MKNLKYSFLIFAVLLFAGCEDYFGADSNVDPDNPISVTESVILPQVQARLAYTIGGDFSRYLSIYTDQIDGEFRQFVVIENYGILGGDVDNLWSNIYTGSMQSNRRMIQQAETSGFNHYVGAGKALEALAFMMATDVWGDIPYSDALKFDEQAVYSPAFDAQEQVYNALFSLLDEARASLLMDDGGLPLDGDLVYGGDAAQWVKFCNVLEARGRLHLAKKDNANYQRALDALGKGGYSGSADDFDFAFGTGATENAPWFQYIEQRDDIEVSDFYVSLLTQFNDPRLATYGAIHDGDHPIYTRDRELDILSYTEQEFMRAEALLMTGNADDAYTAYLAGIESSFNEAALADPEADYTAYVAQSNVGVGASNLTLNNIMTQKYLALLTHPEVFNDWRRTGLPALTPNTGSQIPRRLPYPQTEIFSNENLTTQVDIYSSVWWDQ